MKFLAPAHFPWVGGDKSWQRVAQYSVCNSNSLLMLENNLFSFVKHFFLSIPLEIKPICFVFVMEQNLAHFKYVIRLQVFTQASQGSSVLDEKT